MTNTDSKAAINDITTVVRSSLFQPLADLIGKLLAKRELNPYPSGKSSIENGYSVVRQNEQLLRACSPILYVAECTEERVRIQA